MEEGLKRRLVGASILAGLAVILIPMFLEEKTIEYQKMDSEHIPEKPERFIQPLNPSPLPQIVLNREQPVAYQAEPVKPVMPEMIKEVVKTVEPVELVEPNEPVKAKEPIKPLVIDVAKVPKTEKPNIKTALKSGWVIQVGSFSKKDNAAKVKTSLVNINQPVIIQSIEVNGRNIHRVLVGVFKDKAKTKKVELELASWFKKMGLKGGVRQYK